MRVCYLGRKGARTAPDPSVEGDVLELLWDAWDDFGFKTAFGVTCRINGDRINLGGLRLLVSGEKVARDSLDKLRAKGWDGNFPTPDIEYVSVPTAITFYQQLKVLLGVDGAKSVALALRDASYMVATMEDENAMELADTGGFLDSLLRERGSRTAYDEGWKILSDQDIAVKNFQFNFKDVFDERSTLSLNFDSDSVLPHEINVLIGPNGAGKSQVLHQMVRSWIHRKHGEGFVTHPNLTQLVIVSYSPFELFPVDVEALKIKDKDIYQYFGFRGRMGDAQDGKQAAIRLSREFPKIDAVRSLLRCAIGDQKFRAITEWAVKVATMERVLRTAFDFDFAAVMVQSEKSPSYYYLEPQQVTGTRGITHEGIRYIPVSSHTVQFLNTKKLESALNLRKGIQFFKDGEPIELSSGQRLFTYVVVNLLGVIRRNSLVLIDEPELFLHPTLEIQFIDMLKSVLKSFGSKALLATHSEVMVREVPASCVHVFQRTIDSRLSIAHPPFETFGGDIQRISSYVFGDDTVSKPFEKWLTQQLKNYTSKDDLIEAIGQNISEELLVQIKSMNWEQ